MDATSAIAEQRRASRLADADRHRQARAPTAAPHYRAATPDDLDAACDLLRALPRHDRYLRFHGPVLEVSRRHGKALLATDAGGDTILAEVGDQLIGAATCMPMPDGRAELAVVVDPAHRRRGIGLRLLRLATAGHAGRPALGVVVGGNRDALDLGRRLDPGMRSRVESGCVYIDLTVPPDETSRR